MVGDLRQITGNNLLQLLVNMPQQQQNNLLIQITQTYVNLSTIRPA